MSRFRPNNGAGPSFNNNVYPLEQQNDMQADQLAEKLSLLKDISIQIGSEVRSQNTFLGNMQDDMGNTDDMLSKTMNRLKTAAKQSPWMCYLILFILGILFLFYFFL